MSQSHNIPVIADRCIVEVNRRGKPVLQQSCDCGQVYTITEVYRRGESLTLVIADRYIAEVNRRGKPVLQFNIPVIVEKMRSRGMR